MQRTVSAPHMGSRIEFALVVEVTGELEPTDWESWQANSDTTQAQIQSFDLAYANIYPIDELLECMKGLVLQIKMQGLQDTEPQQNFQEESLSGDSVFIA